MMYHAEMGVTKQPIERIHHEAQSYNKTQECRLLSDAPSVVALCSASAAQSQTAPQRWTPTSGQSSGFERDLVYLVDGLPMESGASRLVWRM